MSEGGRKKLPDVKRKRLEKQVHIKKQAGSLNYLQGPRKKEDGIKSESDLDFHEEDLAVEIYTTDTTTALIGTSPDKTNDHDTLTMIFSSDPGTWPAVLSDIDRCLLVKEGPPKPLTEYNFPHDATGQRLSSYYYTRILKNDEKVMRKWLVYSIKKNLYIFSAANFLAVSLVLFPQKVLKVGSTSLKL
ncbi:zinc finger MYM-type protein 5 [Trichonephila clavipes]|nr:zinc finger MYM-type protein 5 [Trichonephila clavipes]